MMMAIQKMLTRKAVMSMQVTTVLISYSSEIQPPLLISDGSSKLYYWNYSSDSTYFYYQIRIYYLSFVSAPTIFIQDYFSFVYVLTITIYSSFPFVSTLNFYIFSSIFFYQTGLQTGATLSLSLSPLYCIQASFFIFGLMTISLLLQSFRLAYCPGQLDAVFAHSLVINPVAVIRQHILTSRNVPLSEQTKKKDYCGNFIKDANYPLVYLILGTFLTLSFLQSSITLVKK